MLVSKGLDSETRNIHIKLHFNKANHANNNRKKRCGMWEGFPNSKHLDNSTRSLTNSKIFNVSIDMEPLGSCDKAKRENNASK